MNLIASVKLTVTACAGLLLLTHGAATVASAQTAGDELTAPQIAAQSRAAYAALSSYSDSGNVVLKMAGAKNMRVSFNTRLARPNLYRIECLQATGLKGVVWSDGTGDFVRLDPGSPAGPEAQAAVTATVAATGLKNGTNPQKLPNMKAALAHAAGFSYSAATTIPAAFFDQNGGDIFVYPAISGRYPLQKEPDATVGSVDCYVISTVMDLSKAPETGKPGTVYATLWIGKSDLLIHQSHTRYVEPVDESAQSTDRAIDEAIKKSLVAQNKPVTPEAVAALRPQMRVIMKQVQSTLKTTFTAGLETTQTHENISLNPALSPSDFTR